MKSVNYDCLTLKVPDKVMFIAKNANGILFGFHTEPTWTKGEWSSPDTYRWYIGSYDVGVATKESLLTV